MPAEVPVPVGLCEGCRHARIVATPRSRFWLCERSRYDASYARYPRLPVLECRGYEPGSPAAADASTARGGEGEAGQRT